MKNKQAYMIIESLHDRMRECTKESCNQDRLTFHHDMMRMEARRLLELLGTGTTEQEMRDNLKNFAKTAASVMETLKSEFNFDQYKNKRKGAGK